MVFNTSSLVLRVMDKLHGSAQTVLRSFKNWDDNGGNGLGRY